MPVPLPRHLSNTRRRLIFQRISLAVVCNELSKATIFRNDSVLRIVPQVYWLERFTANRVNFGNDVLSLWTLSSAESVSVSIRHRQARSHSQFPGSGRVSVCLRKQAAQWVHHTKKARGMKPRAFLQIQKSRRFSTYPPCRRPEAWQEPSDLP